MRNCGRTKPGYEATAKMKQEQEQARGLLREVPQLDVSHGEDADGDAAE